VIVASVVEGGQQVVGFDEADGETAAGTQVESTAEIGGKGCAGIASSRRRPLNQRSARTRETGQHLAEGLQRRVLQPWRHEPNRAIPLQGSTNRRAGPHSLRGNYRFAVPPRLPPDTMEQWLPLERWFLLPVRVTV